MKAIVAALDFSDVMPSVIEAAGKMALAFQQRLYLVHVVEQEPMHAIYGMRPEEIPVMTEYHDVVKQRAALKMEEARKLLDPAVADVHGEVLEGSPMRELLRFVHSVQAEMIVLGSHGHSAIGSLFMGSVATSVVRKAEIPTLVIPSKK